MSFSTDQVSRASEPDTTVDNRPVIKLELLVEGRSPLIEDFISHAATNSPPTSSSPPKKDKAVFEILPP